MKLCLLLLCAALPASGTSCVSSGPSRVCAIFHEQQIIFKGRLIAIKYESAPGVIHWTLYEFRVDEAFKGLASGSNTVFVTGWSNLGGNPEFSDKVDYLIYARSSETLRTYLERAKVSKTWYGIFERIPSRWIWLMGAPVIRFGPCDNTKRPVKVDDPDLPYLRLAAKGDLPKGGIFEIVAGQNLDVRFGETNFVSVSGADIILENGANKFTYRTNSNGAVVTKELPPGTYSVSVSKGPFGSGRIIGTGPEVFLPPGGCAVVHASFPTSARVKGVVVDWQGQRVAHARVELAELLPDREVKNLPDWWKNTDKEGRFAFERVPSGRILVGVNMHRSPSESLPFDTTYMPGVSDPGKARLLELTPTQQVTGVQLRLPKPLLFGWLIVLMEWADGSPAFRGGASADWNGMASATNTAIEKSNRVGLHLALGRTYVVKANWWDHRNRRSIDGIEGKQVNFTSNGQTVTLRLKEGPPKSLK